MHSSLTTQQLASPRSFTIGWLRLPWTAKGRPVKVAACMNQWSRSMMHAEGQVERNRPLDFPKKNKKRACTVLWRTSSKLWFIALGENACMWAKTVLNELPNPLFCFTRYKNLQKIWNCAGCLSMWAILNYIFLQQNVGEKKLDFNFWCWRWRRVLLFWCMVEQWWWSLFIHLR